jgi:hypothetical protein
MIPTPPVVVLKCLTMESGEQYAVKTGTLIMMLGLYADSWDSLQPFPPKVLVQEVALSCWTMSTVLERKRGYSTVVTMVGSRANVTIVKMLVLNVQMSH